MENQTCTNTIPYHVPSKKNTGIPTTIADVIVAVEANDQLV